MVLHRFAFLTVAAAYIGSPTALADDRLPPAQYFIKQDEPAVGSRIPRRLVEGNQIPINRTYVQLTPEEQHLVKSQYETIADGDEPPFPVDGMKPIYEAIAKIQHKLLAKGLLSMHADIDASGKVTGVTVYQSPDPKLTEAAATVLMLTSFKPAVCSGRPCKMAFPLRVTFKVDL